MHACAGSMRPSQAGEAGGGGQAVPASTDWLRMQAQPPGALRALRALPAALARADAAACQVANRMRKTQPVHVAGGHHGCCTVCQGWL